MSQSGFTPIQIYRSSTAAAVPLAADLAAGELAINTTDEKLYFENASGVVKLLASSAATGGTFTTVTATTVVNGLGAVGTPSYTFTGDLNTGMWSPAADTVAVSTAGAERLRVDSAGAVAIGTATPGGGLILDVSGNGRFIGDLDIFNVTGGAVNSKFLKFGSGSLSNAAAIYSLTSSGTAGNLILATAQTGTGTITERMRIDSSGNVGIGTSAPASILDVRTAAGSGPFLVLVNTSATANTNVIETSYTLNNASTGSSTVAVIGATNPFAVGNTYGDIYFKTTNPTNGLTEKMRIDSAGNVGIGTAAPGVKLDVTGSAIRVTNTTGYNSSSAVRFDIGASNDSSVNNSATYQWSMNTAGDANGQSLVFSAYRRADTTIERMRLTAAGAVLVGTTTTPGSPNARIVAGGTSDAGIQLASTSGGGALILAPNGAGTAFYTYTGAVGSESYTERMRIDSTGILGLATTPSAWVSGLGAMQMTNGSVSSLNGPYGQINLTSNAYATGSADIGLTTWRYARGAIGDLGGTARYSMTGAEHFWFTAAPGVAGDAISYTQRMTLDSSGNLLLGTTSNGLSNTNSITFEPKVSGGGYAVFNHETGSSSGRQYIYFGYAGGNIGSITQSGTTAVLYNVTSDARLKENISDADNASSLIDALQVRKFDWKSDNSHQRYGFVAQELLEVAPEAVHQPADPDEMMGVDYSKLVPMLVKEVQSLRARVAQLEGK